MQLHGIFFVLTTTFLPPNNLSFPLYQKNEGLSFEEYDHALSKVERVYRPIARQYGGRLIVNRLWESATVNAGTLRETGTNNWHVNMYGGFARHPRVTVDGLSLVLCHEIGHHIGGAPKKKNSEGIPFWSSAEGQADYFATLKCLRKVFAHDDNVRAIGKIKVPSVVRRNCELSFKRPREAALCIRTSLAGLSVASVNAEGRRLATPQFEIADQSLVEETMEKHPHPQCRLETYFQGSLCRVSSMIPLSQANDVTGTCHLDKGHSIGIRPGCWYRD